ncbi:hypothetical protein ZEAMMB73_Zm00001d053556 [Zea mays]|uniref:Uncharacterized protein n=1 Tax=Zea mays TaxID=4577 RepID=A0A1D6QQ23_MAIZE|nr:hypothetical protein ZEAMMB73_Zm00001d053556 [Zea mays]
MKGTAPDGSNISSR